MKRVARDGDGIGLERIHAADDAAMYPALRAFAETVLRTACAKRDDLVNMPARAGAAGTLRRQTRTVSAMGADLIAVA